MIGRACSGLNSARVSEHMLTLREEKKRGRERERGGKRRREHELNPEERRYLTEAERLKGVAGLQCVLR